MNWPVFRQLLVKLYIARFYKDCENYLAACIVTLLGSRPSVFAFDQIVARFGSLQTPLFLRNVGWICAQSYASMCVCLCSICVCVCLR